MDDMNRGRQRLPERRGKHNILHTEFRHCCIFPAIDAALIFFAETFLHEHILIFCSSKQGFGHENDITSKGPCGSKAVERTHVVNSFLLRKQNMFH